MSDPSNELTVEYQLTAEDLAHYFDYTMRTAPGVRRRRSRMQILGAAVLGGMIVYAVVQQQGGLAERATAALATMVVFGVCFGLVWLTMKVWNPRRRQLNDLIYQAQSEQMLIQQSLSLTAEGVVLRHGEHEDTALWIDVSRIEQDDRLIYIYVADVSAYTVPLRAFDTPADAQMFIATAVNHHQHAQHGG